MWKFIFALGSAFLVVDISSASKISPVILDKLECPAATVNILVSMKEGTADVLSQVSNSLTSDATKPERAWAVYNALTAHATRCQRQAMDILQEFSTTSFWITNQIYVENADKLIIQKLVELDQVSSIDEEQVIFLPEEPVEAVTESARSPRVEWGIEIINAPQAWALPGGNDGTGARVATIDTGVRVTHEALASNYVGASNYGWYDAYTKSSTPFDDQGHGSHVTGTICGSLGIGVAPGARWMACKALRSDNSGTSTAFIACGQFMNCPTDPQGNNPDCSKAPHVVSNSWMATGEGGGVTWYNAVINAWTTSGIIGVFANGNSGPNCRTGMSPADNRNVIAVGATTSTNGIASFSGVGPSYYGDIKPDISAPGQSVRSSYYTSDTAYYTMSGTSMATPHVAGLLALMHGYNPNITFAEARSVLEMTAFRDVVSGGKTCGGVSDSEFPNNHFGHGRIDALAAMRSLIGN